MSNGMNWKSETENITANLLAIAEALREQPEVDTVRARLAMGRLYDWLGSTVTKLGAVTRDMEHQLMGEESLKQKLGVVK